MKTTRTYVMRERAERAERTRERVLTATVALGYSRPLAQLTLQAVADRAGVSVQTVLRQFGTRDELIAAAIEHEQGQVRDDRVADPDDLAASLRSLLVEYERLGDGMIRILGQEEWEPAAAAITGPGRALHRSWVMRAFAPAIAAAADAAAATDLLVAATDLYVWKLFRRDRGLGRDATAARIRALVDAVLASLPSGPGAPEASGPSPS
ncbi:TetR/AcrR family transcriptional regulator [Gryllotalpicola protaetiae]|uniref:TetR/AcrR family transcriptional regulator n=1 Tax=Gryllotalpicola protaetiae TaxID=2419771 RepID=A0A387BK04_9MICO|nr:TetR/AcrR family transcriptional regulator [Gryllotalpicola protaetiae]AYG04465.1 TetR/AcrR family transcriptional regulator [Gryllotalpicola protaetiae]